MLTSPALLTNANAAQQSQSATSLSQLGDDYNKFLTLLTAQISNQDPLAPVDSTQFVAQLAQLSQVEQAVQTNDRMELLTNQVAGLMNLSGTDLIGRNVKATSNIAWLEDGAINSTYALADGAVDVEARFIDPLGRTVRTIQGLATDAYEEMPLVWDGKDDAGNPQLDGKYTIQIVATDAEGEPVAVEVSRNAKVKEVIFQDGEILFNLQGDEVVSSVTVLSAS